MSSIFRICSKCGNRLDINPGTPTYFGCQKCGGFDVQLPQQMILRCGVCKSKINVGKEFNARHCNNSIFTFDPNDNFDIDISQQRAIINCIRCGSKYEHPTESIPANLCCKTCGSDDIFIKFQEYRSARLKCACGRETNILTGEPIKAYHDYPHCKRYELSIYPPIEDLERVEKKETISAIVLCHNLLSITKRCIEALRNSSVIPNQIILVDNASTDDTPEWALKQGDITYIRNQVNLGCAIGRNQGAKWATSDYLLFLDNDQFVSRDDIIKLLGKGKDLVGVESWRVVSGDGYVGRTKVLDDQSYIGAGGLLIKRSVFEALKGFDERFAPAWFEDVDFSFRARLGGYSLDYVENHNVEHLGNKTSGSQNNFDSSKAKKDSQALFTQIWGKYINNRQKPMNGIYSLISKSAFSIPSVLIIIDVADWAWGNKARQIEKYLRDEFDIKIMTHNDISSGRVPEGYDIYFTFEVNFWKYIAGMRGVRITGVTAHTYQNMSNWNIALKNADAIHANSMILKNELDSITGRQTYYLPNGVDEFQFNYKELNGNKFSVGYVGKDIKRKGLDIIRKACELAGVELKTQACRYTDSNRIKHCDMPKFYEDVSVIAVASDMDGTPNQLLEGAAVGRCCVGNRIGNLPEFIENGVNGFLLEDRDPKLYAEKFKWLKARSKQTRVMGRKARETVENNWNWAIMAENYRSMFRQVLGK